MNEDAVPPSVWFYDGRNANRWTPVLIDAGDSFTLAGDDPSGARWSDGPHAWSTLKMLRAADGRVSYVREDAPGWRFGFPGDAPPALAAKLPKREARYGGWIDRLGLWRAVAVFTPVAAAVVFALYQSPKWIVPIIPISWENKMGDQMTGEFGMDQCRTKEGDAALAKLTALMDPDKRVRSIKVVQMPVPNAYAMPGGHIVIFHGLLEDAEHPAEVAGIIGHEIGHVVHRDSMEALVRGLGVGVLLGNVGGNAGAVFDSLAQMSYSRDAENEADAEAIERLKRVSVSPAPTAAFFDRLGDEEPDGEAGQAMAFLSTHPLSDERKQRFLNAVEKGKSYRSPLSEAEWEALKFICRDGGPSRGGGQ